MSRNVGASVRARLLNLSRQTRADYNQLLTRYASERLLYRLGASRHRADFVLKGALLFTLWRGTPHRATRDIDLLAFGDDSPPRLERIFRQICAQRVEDDGLVFDPDSVRAEEIRAIDEYGGVRVTLRGSLGGAALSLQIDMGFGDSVIPAPTDETFPTLLDLPAPRIRAYPRESVVAEKLEAIVKLGMLNTRLKDYFDLAYLAANFEFRAQPLRRSVHATFQRRGTVLPTDTPAGLTATFAAEKEALWFGFCSRARITDAAPLGEVIDQLQRFASPLLASAPIPELRTARWPRGGPWQ